MPFEAHAAGPRCPPYLNLRYDEDWSVIQDGELRCSWLDGLKYIRLGSKDGAYLTVGGETRHRYELRRNPGFGSEVDDPGGFYLQRVLLHTDLHLGRWVRVFTELQSGLAAGQIGGPRPTDVDELDLHQAFADLNFGRQERGLTLRIGRQEIEFGSSRLISTRDGLNTRLSMDAARVLFTSGSWRGSAHLFRPVLTNPGVFDDSRDSGRALWGAYLARLSVAPTSPNSVFYYIAIHRDEARFDQGVAEERRHTLGTRVWGRNRNWDYNWEASVQLGRFGDSRIRAWDLATDNGWLLSTVSGKPRFGLRFDVTSGDADREDDALGTFNALFPGTAYSGLLGLIGPANAVDLAPSVALSVSPQLSMTGGFARFWRQRLDDGVYGIAVNLLRSGAESRARHIGDQSTVQVSFRPHVHSTFFAAASYFRVGRFLREVPPAEDVFFFTAWVSYRF